MVYLMYHDIVCHDDKSSGFQNDNAFQYKVDVTRFEKQVKVLQGHDVVFTFDDGGDSFLTYAAPILEKYGKKGVFFISTKYIGTKGFLNENQIKELSARGHIIASHSHSHPSNISSLPEEEIFNEWKKSIIILRNIIGTNILEASVPNGYTTKSVVNAAMKNGIVKLYTSEPTIKPRSECGLTLIGRYVVHSNMSEEDVLELVTNRKLQYKKYLIWSSLRFVKMLLGGYYDKIKSLMLNRKFIMS